MNFAISYPPRIALFALALSISASSALAFSSNQTERQSEGLVIAQDTKPAKTPPPPPSPTKKTPAKKQPTSKPQEPSKDKESAADNAPLVYVLMQTSMGDIVIELNREKAPITVKNFLSYTDKKYYDGTIFHRVMRRFMIQGGGFTEDMRKKPVDKPIKNEWKNGLKNVTGSIAMARLGRRPNSATAQFFINVKDNTSLDQPNDGAGYAVFGKVVAGMKVIRKIEGSRTTAKGSHGNVPIITVLIKIVSRLTDAEAKKLIEQEKQSATTKPGTP